MATQVDIAGTNLSASQLKELFRLAAIPGGHVNRQSLQLYLEGKNPFDTLQPSSFVIHVDRSIRPVYPDWVKTVMHPELEATGPVEYELGTIDPWLHDDQKSGRTMEGHKLYEYLREKKMLESCLSLRDGEEIQKKGRAIFRKFFQGKAVFLWKSVVQRRNGLLSVPCLVEDGGGVVVCWAWLDDNWDDRNPTLRVAS